MNQISEMKTIMRILAYPKRGTDEEKLDICTLAERAQKIFSLAYLEDDGPGYSSRAENIILAAASDGELKHKAAERVIETLLGLLESCSALVPWPEEYTKEVSNRTRLHDAVNAVLQPSNS